MKLPTRDKLALMMTAHASVRSAARELGITHQKLGRWLREGEPGGVKAIPTDTFTTAAINIAFKAHSRVAQKRARADNLPFNPQFPAVVERLPMTTRDGAQVPGERAVIKHSQFLGPGLLSDVLRGAHKSKKFISVSIRSVVDLANYMRAAFDRSVEDGERRPPRSRAERRRAVDRMVADFSEGSKAARTLDDHGGRVPLFTRHQNFSPGTATGKAVRGVEQYLREKHEPATHDGTGPIRGTLLADQILFQTLPLSDNENDKPRPRAGERIDPETGEITRLARERRPTTASRKRVKGRGAK